MTTEYIKWRNITTVGLIRVISAVIVAITEIEGADAKSIGTLESSRWAICSKAQLLVISLIKKQTQTHKCMKPMRKVQHMFLLWLTPMLEPVWHDLDLIFVQMSLI